jgi:2-methylisocitrate lyase-like PEP mutase family enzyme
VAPCSLLGAHAGQGFELWPQCVEEVQVLLMVNVTAASHRAGQRAHPLEPVGVQNVLCPGGVRVRVQVGQLLQPRKKTTKTFELCPLN